MRKILVLAAVAGLMFSGAAMAQEGATTAAPAAAPAAAAATGFSTDTSTIGELLGNDATRAVLEAQVPDLVANPQIQMAASMTLKQIQAYAPDLTDSKLAEIDAALAEIH